MTCTNTRPRDCLVKILEQALKDKNVFGCEELSTDHKTFFYLNNEEMKPVLFNKIKIAKNTYCKDCSYCVSPDYELE